MNTITDSKQLKQRISELEIRIIEHKEVIGEHKKALIHKLQPANIIRSALGTIGKAPDIKLKMVSVAVMAGAGFLFRKFFARKVMNTGRNLLIDVVKTGITGFISARAKKRTNV